MLSSFLGFPWCFSNTGALGTAWSTCNWCSLLQQNYSNHLATPLCFVCKSLQLRYRFDSFCLVVWNIWIIFPFSWECHHPNWLSYFSEGLKPPTRLSWRIILDLRHMLELAESKDEMPPKIVRDISKEAGGLAQVQAVLRDVAGIFVCFCCNLNLWCSIHRS